MDRDSQIHASQQLEQRHIGHEIGRHGALSVATTLSGEDEVARLPAERLCLTEQRNGWRR